MRIDQTEIARKMCETQSYLGEVMFDGRTFVCYMFAPDSVRADPPALRRVPLVRSEALPVTADREGNHAIGNQLGEQRCTGC